MEKNIEDFMKTRSPGFRRGTVKRTFFLLGELQGQAPERNVDRIRQALGYKYTWRVEYVLFGETALRISDEAWNKFWPWALLFDPFGADLKVN